MEKIATHDSVTGEKRKGILSLLVTPFAKTQSKTIKQQYEAGCRMFDLRAKYDKHNKLVCAHGLWRSEKSLYDVLREINKFKEKCVISITYEGKLSDDEIDVFSTICDVWHNMFTNIDFGYVAVKYGKKSNGIRVKYDIIQWYNKIPFAKTEQAFLPLDGRSWHVILPIPWLWKMFYFKKVEFNDEYYKFVDFL